MFKWVILLLWFSIIPSTLIGQDSEPKGFGGMAILINKSLYTSTDYGITTGTGNWFLPDIAVEFGVKDLVICGEFHHYYSRYEVPFKQDAVELRKFQLYELIFKTKKETKVNGLSFLFGLGISIRDLREWRYAALTKIGPPGNCWYEVHTAPKFMLSPGPIVQGSLRYNLSKRLFASLDCSYSVYFDSYNMGRTGLSIGYCQLPHW